MKKQIKKRLASAASLILVLALVITVMPAPSFAASIDPDDKSVCYIPSSDYKSGDCILTSSRTMIRRAAIIRGSTLWSQITNKSLRGHATVAGLLLNNFKYEADGLQYKVGSGLFSGKTDAARIKEIEALLKTHPEGIVVHGTKAATTGTHGVLAVAVKNGVVYAIDSTHNMGSSNKGVEKWSKTTMKNISKVSKYWYIKEIGLAKGAKEPAEGQPLLAASASDEDTSSFLAISGQTVPSVVNQGSGFSVRGIVYSNYRIKKLTVGIFDTDGNAINAETVKPNTWSYDLAEVDKLIVFGRLSKGTYRYIVNVTDEKITETLIDAKFNVVLTSKLRIKSCRKPKTIKQGKGFNIKGKVKSNRKIKDVTVQITDLDGNVLYTASAAPGKKSYNIKKLSKYMMFRELPKGYFYYKVKATDTAKTKTLVKKKFRVK